MATQDGLSATELKHRMDAMFRETMLYGAAHGGAGGGAGGAGGVGGLLYGSPQPTPAPTTKHTLSSELEKMVSMRLRSARSSFFDHWHMHKYGDKVFVVIFNDGQCVHIEDTWPLFPSDALITQLRLLEK
jgi:hypothetical protein